MREVNFHQTLEERIFLCMLQAEPYLIEAQRCIEEIGVSGTTHPELNNESVRSFTKNLMECKEKFDELLFANKRRDRMLAAHKVMFVVAHEVVRGVSHG